MNTSTFIARSESACRRWAASLTTRELRQVLAVEEKVGRRIAAEKSSNTAAIFTAELNRRTRETSEYSLKTHGIATPKRTASYGNFTTSF